jgi:uncharacterized membrane protein
MSGPAATSRHHWKLDAAAFAARPNLIAAIAAGLFVGVAAAALTPDLRLISCLIAGWDVFCVTFLGLTLRSHAGHGPDDIRSSAAMQDQGRATILLIVLTASAASVGAVGLELSLAQAEAGWAKGLRVAACVLTLGVSWFLIQTVYALHYAHAYYTLDPATGEDVGGLIFPGGETPDYRDFLHFAIVIGVAAQTADVAFSDRRLRRLGTGHSLIAFVFNTLIVALAINLVAGLF